MLNFEGKVVVVVGAAGGICSFVSKLFFKQGAKVVNCDLRYPKKTMEEIDFADNPVNINLDITSKAQVEKTVDTIYTVLGRIDVVINGAGIVRAKRFIDITEEEWDHMFNINLKGMFFVCQAAAKCMMQQKSGTFVNISSISGKMGGVLASADYSSSKAGVIGLTKSLAKFGAQYGFRANSVAPGAVETEMLDVYKDVIGNEEFDKGREDVPMKRWGKPIEIANAILFLASDEASYITGACMDINGGELMD